MPKEPPFQETTDPAPDVPDEQFEVLKVEAERRKLERTVPVAHDFPNTLDPAVRTERNPLVPQPAPDADPLVPNVVRPSRSRSEENTVDVTKKSGPDAAETVDIAVVEHAGRDVRDPDGRLVSRDRQEDGRVLSHEEQEAVLADEVKRNTAAQRRAAENRRLKKAEKEALAERKASGAKVAADKGSLSGGEERLKDEQAHAPTSRSPKVKAEK